jgi:hypothetical protein
MAKATVEIQHPRFDNVRQTVNRDDVKDWTDQGWKRVKADDRTDVEPTA